LIDKKLKRAECMLAGFLAIARTATKG